LKKKKKKKKLANWFCSSLLGCQRALSALKGRAEENMGQKKKVPIQFPSESLCCCSQNHMARGWEGNNTGKWWQRKIFKPNQRERWELKSLSNKGMAQFRVH